MTFLRHLMSCFRCTPTLASSTRRPLRAMPRVEAFEERAVPSATPLTSALMISDSELPDAPTAQVRLVQGADGGAAEVGFNPQPDPPAESKSAGVEAMACSNNLRGPLFEGQVETSVIDQVMSNLPGYGTMDGPVWQDSGLPTPAWGDDNSPSGPSWHDDGTPKSAWGWDGDPSDGSTGLTWQDDGAPRPAWGSSDDDDGDDDDDDFPNPIDDGGGGPKGIVF